MKPRIGRAPRRVRPLFAMRGLTAAVLLVVSGASALQAQDAPRTPCEQPVVPGYPAAGQPPAVQVWDKGDLRQAGWTPPRCIPWTGPSNLVMAVAGRFHSAESAEQLLARLGRISAYPTIRYWSGKNREWKPLAKRAWAVESESNRSPRGDFSGTEVGSGAPLYYTEEGDKTGIVLYRIQAIVNTPDHIVVSIENVSPIRFHFLKLFDPGALQTVLFFDRLSPDIWGLYQLTRTGKGTSFFAGGHESSYINRDVAIFRYFAQGSGERAGAAGEPGRPPGPKGPTQIPR